MKSDEKPNLFLVSHVIPLGGTAGQQMRVRNKLIAFRNLFHVTFVTVAKDSEILELKSKLLESADEVVVLPSVFHKSVLSRFWYRAIGRLVAFLSGVKFSNYVLGKLEFTSKRLTAALSGRRIDIAVFEYWHSVGCVPTFRQMGIPTVLDMHNILWRSHERNLQNAGFPEWLRRILVDRYRRKEELAWREYDALIAINRNEWRYAQERGLSGQRVYYAPMGVDLNLWPYSSQPCSGVTRFAYYGGLGSLHNALDAQHCAKHIMPKIWERIPDAEFWIIGSSPPDSVLELAKDPRIHVTGYVEDVGGVLADVVALICPWSGRYGFRSRLVEVMALGVPTIVTPEAVDGMEFDDGSGVFFCSKDEEFAAVAIRLAEDSALLEESSRLARSSVERLYGFESTYGRLASDLLGQIAGRSSTGKT